MIAWLYILERGWKKTSNDFVKKYHTASHSKYLLKAHLVFVCKYRKQLLTYPINKAMKDIMFQIDNKSDFENKD